MTIFSSALASPRKTLILPSMENSNLNQESKGKCLFPESSLYINKDATFENGLPSDIVASILSRLPVKSILRFRCVCKQWFYLLTEDSHFIAQHSNASLKRPVLIPDLANLFTDVPLYEIGPSGGIKDIHVPIKPVSPRAFKLSNPVNGLVYVHGCLLNPFTRDVVQLPKSSRWGSGVFVGLGFDESFRGHCKIVRLISTSDLGCCSCEVLAVGNRGWRYVGDTPRMEPSGHAVFLNGVVHWLAYISYEPLHLGIFAFDIQCEKFQLISIPMAFTHDPHVELQELRGQICLVSYPTSLESDSPWRFLTIWMLKDLEKNEWVQEYDIDMSIWLDRCQFRLYVTQVIEVQDRKILIKNSSAIYSYDLQGKTLHKLCSYPIARTSVYQRCHIITESLVSPRNLLKQSINS